MQLNTALDRHNNTNLVANNSYIHIYSCVLYMYKATSYIGKAHQKLFRCFCFRVHNAIMSNLTKSVHMCFLFKPIVLIE